MRLNHQDFVNRKQVDFVDMATVRYRVAKIQRSWSPEEARQRASEGHRRRAELLQLLSGGEDEVDVPALSVFSGDQSLTESNGSEADHFAISH